MRFPFLLRACLAAMLLGAATAPAAEPEPRFEQHVAPILMRQCLACHNGKKAEGGYRVDTYAHAIAAGDSGAAAVTAGKAGESELLRRIASDDEFERMPLEGEPLPAEQVDLVRRWIEAGARIEDDHRESPLAAIVPAPNYPPAPPVYRQALPVTGLAFSADGQELLVGGYHEVTVWNVAEGTLARRIGNVGQRVYGIDVAPGGEQIAVACGQPGRYGEVRLVEMASGNVVDALAGTGDVVFDARFDPAGERLAVAAADATVRIVRVADGALLQEIGSHSDWVTAVAWSHDGKLLAAASRDQTAKVFDADSGQSLITYTGHDAAVRGVAFHSDGKRVFSAAADGEVHRWNVAEGKREKKIDLPGPAFQLQALGEELLIPTAAGRLQRVSGDTGKDVCQYEGHRDWVLSAARHAETGRVAAGGIDGRVITWEGDADREISSFVAAPGGEAGEE